MRRHLRSFKRRLISSLAIQTAANVGKVYLQAFRYDRTKNSPSRVLSQNEEDGMLLRIFSVIGFGARRFCEFGFHPSECNAAWLVHRHGFSGLWFDTDDRVVNLANAMAWCMRWPVQAQTAHITRENINDLMRPLQAPDGTLDLLSIDVDGNDYWIWDNIDVVTPRVLVIEYNAIFGPEASVVVPYDPNFDRHRQHSPLYFGASLRALEKLSLRKGYRLVGCDANGVNAFFLHHSAGGETDIPTVRAIDCYRPLAGITPQSARLAIEGPAPLQV